MLCIKFFTELSFSWLAVSFSHLFSLSFLTTQMHAGLLKVLFFSCRFTEIGSGDPFPAMRLFQGTSFPLVMACMMVVIKFLFKISFLLVREVAQGIKM